MIEKAAAFAAKAHEGVFRKGTRIPYITHPIEAAVIVSGFTEDEEMIAAALLHDVVEDAGVTREQLEADFGFRVAHLVADESEDKTKSWFERKQNTVRKISGASRDIKILMLGDKLSNIRSTARDYLVMGDAVWQRFNEKDKRKHAWYCWSMADGLEELKEHIYYQEYVMLCQRVFGDRGQAYIPENEPFQMEKQRR